MSQALAKRPVVAFPVGYTARRGHVLKPLASWRNLGSQRDAFHSLLRQQSFHTSQWSAPPSRSRNLAFQYWTWPGQCGPRASLPVAAQANNTGAEACADCTRGYVWEGTPCGTETVLADINTYVTSPPPESLKQAGAILFIHDVFGWSFNNSRLLCGYFAQATGCTVYLPDFFKGETVISPDAFSSTDPSLWGKIQQGLKIAASIPNFLTLTQKFGPEKTQPTMDDVVNAIKEKHGDDGCRLGAVGYCWGGKYVLRLGAQGKLAATVACHPSLLKPAEDELQNTSAPTLFVCAEKDNMFTDKLWKESEALIRAAGAPVERVVFPGTSHGFGIRCDESDKVALEAKDEAARRTAQWFCMYLS